MEWRLVTYPTRRRKKLSESARKVMVIFFWDEEGLIVNFELRGTTGNSDHCTET